MLDALYRSEALDAKRTRVTGDVTVSSVRAHLVSVILMAACALAAVVLLATRPYTQWQTATGYLVPHEGLAGVSAARPGVVTDIFVKEGQAVTRGQALFKIEVGDFGSTDDHAARPLIALLARRERALAGRVDLIMARSHSTRAANDAHLSSLKAQEERLRELITAQTEKANLSRARVRQMEIIHEKGFVSTRDLDEARAVALSEQQSLIEARSKAEGVEADIQSYVAEAASSDIQARIDAEQVKDAEVEVEQERMITERGTSYVIRAPINGRIASLSVGVGATTHERSSLAFIVPDHSRLEAVALVPARSAGFLKAGMTVRVDYDGFPKQQFGAFEGKVLEVPLAILPVGEVSGPMTVSEPAYRVRIQLPQQDVPWHGVKVALHSGMTLRAKIQVRSRTLLQWMAEPLTTAAT